MYKKNFILSLSFVFILGIFIVSVINNTYAMPSNLLNDGDNGGAQFLGADGTDYPMMTCTITYTGCDSTTMQSGCSSVGGTLSGNTCTWKMVDNGVNRCGNSTKVCKNDNPTPSNPVIPPSHDDDDDEPTYSKYCYTCTTEDNIFRRYEWEYNKPSDGTDNCTGWEIDRSISQANCKNESKQCYVCDNNYVWDYNKPSDGTENCTGWNLNSNLDKENCKYVEPEPVPEKSCYKCENDNKLFYWGIKPESGSNECSGTWNEETNIKEESNCKYVEPEIENPPTGSTLLYIMYIMVAISLSYTGYTAYKLIKAKQD